MILQFVTFVNYKLEGDNLLLVGMIMFMKEPLDTVASRLRYTRKNLNKSQADVAQAIGKTTTAYGHYERGRNEMMRDTAIKVAKYLNVDLEWLLTGQKAPEDELLKKLRGLNEKQQRAFEAFVDSLTKET